VTSWVFHSLDIIEIAEMLGRNDLGLEVHLDDFDWEVGNPGPLTSGGVWPRTFPEKRRARLREIAETLPVLTVHGTPFDLNISANNPAIREESIRQYEEAMDLARDIGAKTVTYHPGKPSSKVVPEKVMLERHAEFAGRISKRAEEYGIRTGFENLEKEDDISYFLEIMDRTNSPNWGHLLDIAQAVMGRRGDTRGARQGSTGLVIGWAERIGVQRLVQIHAHGVIAWSGVVQGMVQHRSFEDNTCLDMKAIFGKLKEMGYQGPIILEILESTAEKVIDSCVRAKDMIREIMGR